MLTIKLNDDAINKLNKPVNGNGGHQNFLKKLQGQCSPTLTLYDDDIEKLERYAKEYGKGGYQDRFKAILDCIGE